MLANKVNDFMKISPSVLRLNVFVFRLFANLSTKGRTHDLSFPISIFHRLDKGTTYTGALKENTRDFSLFVSASKIAFVALTADPARKPMFLCNSH